MTEGVSGDPEQQAALPNKPVPPQAVSGDRAGLILGPVAGRKEARERAAFVFRGHALGDLALAALAHIRFQERG